MALSERWFFGDESNDDDPNPILRSYFIYTFAKLRRENQIIEHHGQVESWAAFNTGLVSKLYEPIYALFGRNDREEPFWKFQSFCLAGIGKDGKKLTSTFAPLPQPPKYFEKSTDLLFDVDQEIFPDFDHIVYDGILKERFPYTFLELNKPRGLDWKDPSDLDFDERKEYLRNFVNAIENDPQCNRSIVNRIRDAIDLAFKRTRWNFKTAIPQYFPTTDSMSLLLPLALVDDESVDIALVVNRNETGSYSAPTVLPLNWAYSHARLVCRPDSDWLMPRSIEVTAEDQPHDDEQPDSDT